jgi:hypothetical protein
LQEEEEVLPAQLNPHTTADVNCTGLIIKLIVGTI